METWQAAVVGAVLLYLFVIAVGVWTLLRIGARPTPEPWSAERVETEAQAFWRAANATAQERQAYRAAVSRTTSARTLAEAEVAEILERAEL